METTRFYHVAHESYEVGDPIYSRQRCRDHGIETPWKWDYDESVYDDADTISLFRDLEDAQEFAEEFPGVILAVDLPADEADRRECEIRLSRNREGFDIVMWEIPAECVTIL